MDIRNWFGISTAIYSILSLLAGVCVSLRCFNCGRVGLESFSIAHKCLGGFQGELRECAGIENPQCFKAVSMKGTVRGCTNVAIEPTTVVDQEHVEGFQKCNTGESGLTMYCCSDRDGCNGGGVVTGGVHALLLASALAFLCVHLLLTS